MSFTVRVDDSQVVTARVGSLDDAMGAVIVKPGRPFVSGTLLHERYDEFGRWELLSELEPARYDGSLFWLGYPWRRNYQHWLIESFPRVYFWLMGLRQDVPGCRLLVQADDYWTFEALELLGLSVEDCCVVRRPGDPPMSVRHLYVPSFVSENFDYVGEQAWAVYKQLKEAALGTWRPMDEDRKLYVTRRDVSDAAHWHGRVMTNEWDVAVLAREQGYREVMLSSLDLVHQIRNFLTASHVLAEVGAGLANLVFCTSRLKKLVVIQHPRCGGHFFSRLVPQSCEPHFTHRGKLESVGPDANVPWRCDVDEVRELLASW